MYIICSILGLLCIVFLILYIRLKLQVASLSKQLQYTIEEDSTFTLFSSSLDQDILHILRCINQIQSKAQEVSQQYHRKEKDGQDMIANISHDIRTPLTSIQGYVEMIQHSDKIEERTHYYQIVMMRLHDLEAILDEFFLYTRLVNANELYPLEEKAVYPMVCQTLLKYVEQLKEHDLIPEVICEDENITAFIHEEVLLRICTNLVINTIRYGHNPFQIEIKKDGESVSIVFSNKCSESESEIDVEHLFDRFYKGNKARTQIGSGLGLAIVKELCIQMQAHIDATYHEQILQIRMQFKSK